LSEHEDKLKALEDLDNGVEILSFTIPGRAATKKTNQRVIRRGRMTRILPSIQFENYEKSCKDLCENLWKNLDYPPIDCGISINCKIYLNNWIIGDESNYYQSFGDLIQTHGILNDDIWIHWVDNGENVMMEPDKENPRVEFIIKRHRHPKEKFRDGKRIKEAKRLKNV
jgi:hypothetical protein